MGATLFSQHKVFKSNVSVEENALFGNETIVVASKRCEKNVYPHDYSWCIEFIGSEDTFINRYLPETAYFFDDGLSQASYLKNGKEFQEHIKQLYNKAKYLTVDELREIEFYGYSWPDESVEKLSDSRGLKEFSYYLGKRHARVIKSEDDVYRMVKEAYAIVPSTSKYIWMSCLWRLDLERSNAISHAKNAEVFQVF